MNGVSSPPASRPLRFVMCGAGFWSHYQLAAWRELPGAQCVGICDSNLDRAAALANRFGIEVIVRDLTEAEATVPFDFVDIVSSPESHAELVRHASCLGKSVICQKPMTESWSECVALVEYCRDKRTWFAIHENWRWQKPLARVRELIVSGVVGEVFRCHLEMVTGFDVYANQPSLRHVKDFIIADLGCHLIDYARSLFGEAEQVSCQTRRTSPSIAGEDVASLLLSMNDQKTIVTIDMAYARTPIENDAFPQTLLRIEGTLGSIRVCPGYEIRITRCDATEVHCAPPDPYPWIDPKYAVVHSSLVDCNRSLLHALVHRTLPPTSAFDNLRTMQLVFAAYESAKERKCVAPRTESNWLI